MKKNKHIRAKSFRAKARRERRKNGDFSANLAMGLDQRLSIFNLMPYGDSFALQREVESAIGLETSVFAQSDVILSKIFVLDDGEILAMLAASFNEEDALGQLTLSKIYLNQKYANEAATLVAFHLDKDHDRVTVPSGVWLQKGLKKQLDLEKDGVEVVDFGDYRISDTADAFVKVQAANAFITEHLQVHGEKKISLSRGGEIRVKK